MISASNLVNAFLTKY